MFVFNLKVSSPENLTTHGTEYSEHFDELLSTGRDLVLDKTKFSKIAVGDDQGQIRILDENFSLVCFFKAHESGIKFIKYFPEQNLLATCSSTVKIWISI